MSIHEFHHHSISNFQPSPRSPAPCRVYLPSLKQAQHKIQALTRKSKHSAHFNSFNSKPISSTNFTTKQQQQKTLHHTKIVAYKIQSDAVSTFYQRVCFEKKRSACFCEWLTNQIKVLNFPFQMPLILVYIVIIFTSCESKQ